MPFPCLSLPAVCLSVWLSFKLRDEVSQKTAAVEKAERELAEAVVQAARD
eukprot:SAG22_NODE_10092_length_553_cov_1.240088_1_plen_49_part_10